MLRVYTPPLSRLFCLPPRPNLGCCINLNYIDAAAMPFATGAMIYHYKDELAHWIRSPIKIIDSYVPLLLCFTIAANWFLGETTRFLLLKGAGFYINFTLCALMVVTLITRPLLPIIPRWLDSKIGDLSYPIYLIHLQMGLIVYTALNAIGVNIGRMGLMILLPTIPLIILCILVT
jgi:peptidoglycan/LPS O-acetylase OafA/YrhL